MNNLHIGDRVIPSDLAKIRRAFNRIHSPVGTVVGRGTGEMSRYWCHVQWKGKRGLETVHEDFLEAIGRPWT